MSDTEVAPLTGDERAAADGATTSLPAYVDYFAFDEREKIMLPDGVQWVEIKKLTEGDRKKYQNKVNRDVRLERKSGDAMLRMAAGDEKHALLESAITDFHLIKQGREIKFGEGTLREFLSSFPPFVIDLIEKAVRKSNPWLMAEMTVEDIDKQIDELREMRDAKVKEQEGKDTSSVA